MESRPTPLPPYLWLLLLIPIVQVAFGVAVWHAIPELQARGLFGDMFGALNALFSGLAFAAIFITLLLQQRELAAQRLSNERSARLSAISALIAAYTERARYLDTRASPQTGKVQEYQSKIEELSSLLAEELRATAVTARK